MSLSQSPARFVDELGIALNNLAEAAAGGLTPTLRLGVTGLSRAGKTIFITALIHHLLEGTRLPGFTPLAEGRLIGAQLAEAVEANVPRFAYEQHLAALTGTKPHWPESTRQISQIRLALKFRPRHWLRSFGRPALLYLDIVDYPGEWLLDLPLLAKSFAQWSGEALARLKAPDAPVEAAAFLAALGNTDREREMNEPDAERLAQSFAAYLRASRADAYARSMLPPGRFLLPGDLAGSPALTFAPLPLPTTPPRRNTLYAGLERRYEAYKEVVVRPFFRDHFVRLDRQIVLVDVLRALNRGPGAVADLEAALTEILAAFRQGENTPLAWLVARRIDRVLFAATKADHLHHRSHDRLAAVLDRLVAQAARRAKFAGAATASLALAAVRATREGRIRDLDVITGTPEAGERLGDIVYDGKTEIALHPGDLPEAPEAILAGTEAVDVQFLRFLPTPAGADGLKHIRLDRALDFLLKDWLQ